MEKIKKIIKKNFELQEKKGWWFRISKKRWFYAWKGLNTTQRSTLLSLWLYAGNKEVCWASMRRLSEDLEISLLTVFRNIKILEKKKFFRIEKTIGKRGKYNKYFLLK